MPLIVKILNSNGKSLKVGICKTTIADAQVGKDAIYSYSPALICMALFVLSSVVLDKLKEEPESRLLTTAFSSLERPMAKNTLLTYIDTEVFVLKGKNNSSKVCLSSCPQHKKGFLQ